LDTSEFEFSLPPDLIATVPAGRREDARLLVMDRADGSCKHARFHELLGYLRPRSLLVLNDTRVFPARLRGRKATGGAVEFLLTRRMGEALTGDVAKEFSEDWEGLARGLGRSGDGIDVGGGVLVTVRERREAGVVSLRITGPGPSLLAALDAIGEVPLPPYIEAARRRLAESAGTSAAPAIDDRARYQTVYAAAPGAVAAPTAGLHFTPALLDAARAAGHEIAFVTLHVGPGTFRPVEVADPRAHRLEAERYAISPVTAAALGAARAAGRPVVGVGTTVVRTLEASARAHDGVVAAGEGETDLYLLPGDTFRVVTDLITNFHLPRSTLLMLVAAFAGRERVLAAYREAIARGYRFYSYGDAMLIKGSGA
jgi:S-adenosylmethionine:tRNA ribosyltransferase-isomerase